MRFSAFWFLALSFASNAHGQVLLRDDFETGTLLSTDSPPGKWTAIAVIGIGANQQLSVDADAGYVAGYALRLVDAFDGGTGIGNGRYVQKPITEAFGDVYLRYRFRLHTVSGSGGPYPVQLHSSLFNGTIAELNVLGSPTLGRLGCGDSTFAFQACSSSAPISPDTWHIIQLGLEQLGTNNGSCILRIDDQEVCRLTGRTWATHGVTNILAGSGALDRSWDGTSDVDDVLLVQGMAPPTRLMLVGPTTVDAGACVPYLIQVLNDFDGGISAPSVATPIGVSSGAISGLWGNPACSGSPLVALQLAADAGQVYIGLQFTGPSGPASVIVSDLSNDLSSGTLAVTVVRPDAGSDGGVDAGVDAGADSGTVDGGTSDSGTVDGGTVDGGTVDGGTVDSGTVDGGTVDGGTVDGGTVDGGTVDGGTVDGGTVDGGIVDGGIVDGGIVDGGIADAGTAAPFKVGCGCSTSPEASTLALIALVRVLRRRRGSRSR